MEQKKTDKANLENKRGLFLELGLAIVLGLVITAFEWPSVVTKADDLGSLEGLVIDDIDMVPITRTEPEVLPPPPAKQAMADIIEIHSDVDMIEPSDFNLDDDLDAPVEFVELPELDNEPETCMEPNTIYDPFGVEEQAVFPGGEQALRIFVAQNIRYPELAKENEIQGTVYVRFVVDKDGSVVDVEILRGIDPLLDKEAVRVIKTLPKFKPAKQIGKNVKSRMMMPVKFVLQ